MHCTKCGRDIGTKNSCPYCGTAQKMTNPFVTLGDLRPHDTDTDCAPHGPIISDSGDPFHMLGNLDGSPISRRDYVLDAPGVDGFVPVGNLDGAMVDQEKSTMDTPGTGGFKPLVAADDSAASEGVDPLGECGFKPLGPTGSTSVSGETQRMASPGRGGFKPLGPVGSTPVSGGTQSIDPLGRGGFKPMDELVPPEDDLETIDEEAQSGTTGDPKPRITFVWKKWMTIAAACLLAIMGFFTINHSSEGEIHDAQTRIEEKLCDDSFAQLSLDEKYEVVENLTDELYEDGLISQKAVYSGDQALFAFQYADGTYGGISLQTIDEKRNSGLTSVRSSDDERMVSSRTDNALEVIFLNAFEDSSFRRDFYLEVQQEWQAEGINTTIDTLVTLEDLEQLEKYDVFVFSMHGSIYDGSPVLCLNEIATSSTDEKYAKYLRSGSVAKVFTSGDYRYHYWVFPDFFTQCYNAGALDGKVCWSESCEFFGDDALSQEPDTAFSDALLQLSCEAVLGYRNSVGAEYSRNVMKYSLDIMFSGTEVQFALDSAKVTQGHTDGWEDLSEGKREAYPLRYGNLMYIVAKPDEQGVQQQTGGEEWFNETYWHISFGQSLGYNYIAKFSSNGSFVARGMGSGAYENGTYTYSNGKLVIVFDIDGFGYPSTIEFSGNKDGFTSLDKYPMQVGEDYYSISPDDGMAEYFDEETAATSVNYDMPEDGTYYYSLTEPPYFDGTYFCVNLRGLFQDFSDVAIGQYNAKMAGISMWHNAGYELYFVECVDSIANNGNGTYTMWTHSIDGSETYEYVIESDGYVSIYSSDGNMGTGYGIKLCWFESMWLPLDSNCACADERMIDGSERTEMTFEEILRIIEYGDTYSGSYVEVTVTTRDGKITEIILPYYP